MTTLSAHTSRAIHNKGMQAVYGIAAEYNVDAADVIALLGTTSHTSISASHSPFVRLPDSTSSPFFVDENNVVHVPIAELSPNPSQPEPISPPTAADTPAVPPASETDGGRAVLPPSPSVNHYALDTADLDPDRVHLANCIINCGTRIYEGDDHHVTPDDEFYCAKCAIEAIKERQTAKIKPPHGLLSTAPKVSATHAEHPDWPAKLIAEHLGITKAAARSAASREGIVLPSWWEYQRAQAKATAEALRTAVSTPQAAPVEPEPEQPPPAIPDAATAPEPPAKRVTIADKIRAHVAAHPDATLAEVTEAIGGKMSTIGWAAQKAGIVLRKRNAPERSEASARGRARLPETLTPPDESSIQPDETVMSAPQAVHQYRPAPLTTARFYLRDGEGRYLHNSLTKCPTGDGPLMTTDRNWAWHDNSQRYRGALKVWPQIGAMRKESAVKA